MNKNILIVEDESIIAMEIESYIIKLGYTVIDICSSENDAYKKALEDEVDLILMDIFLREGDGIDAAKRIKRHKEIPIIFLTAHMDEKSIERSLEVDPVAYLTKPFNRQELFAAIKIALSKCCTIENSVVGNIYLDYEFSFDSKSAQLICCGEEVHLSKKERQLLALFLDNPNRLISFMTMEYELWPDKPSHDSRRRTLISRLRAKLKHKFIDTLSSEGYVFRI